MDNAVALPTGPTGKQQQQRTFNVLPKPDIFTCYRHAKTREAKSHPDRAAQFEHINAQVSQALADGVPVISVDTKKAGDLGGHQEGR
jgi:hypothetical protein